MAYIYKITNDVNGKIYIGKTYNSIEKRFKEHIADGVKIGGQILKVAEDNNVWWSIGTLGGVTL